LGCQPLDDDDEQFRASPTVTNTLTDRARGVSVSYDYWEVDEVNDAAFVEISVERWPVGQAPVTLADDYLEITFARDSTGEWEIEKALFTQPQGSGYCNHHACSGDACSNIAPNCNCFAGMLGGVTTCLHEWCGGGGGFTPLELDLTP
jgi:hypothetical protein